MKPISIKHYTAFAGLASRSQHAANHMYRNYPELTVPEWNKVLLKDKFYDEVPANVASIVEASKPKVKAPPATFGTKKPTKPE